MKNKGGTILLSLLILVAPVAASGQDASSTTKGITKLSVDPVVATNPIAVGDNDARVNGFKNIISYGAVGDGATDNATALQNAINAGYAVFVPEGTFNFSTTLTLRKDSIIVGIGKKSTLRYTGTGVALQESVGAYTGGADNIKLINFTLTTSSSSTTGIELTNNYQVTIQGLFIDGAMTGFSTAGLHIKSNDASKNSAVIRYTDGEIWSCTGDGIRISGQAGVAGLWVERNHITANFGYGINQTIPAPPYPASQIQINNNLIEGNSAGGISADVLYASSISGNHFENSAGATVPLVKIGTLGFAQGLTVSQNIFGGKSASYNIDMNGPADVTGTIANNVFAGASVAAIRATNARGLVLLNNTIDTSSVPTLVALGSASRSVWIQDFNNASYISGSASTQPNLTVGGKLQIGGLSGPTWTSGAGAPTGACTTGSLYSSTNGGAKTTLYVCEAAAWVAK